MPVKNKKVISSNYTSIYMSIEVLNPLIPNWIWGLPILT